ncbi:CD5 antigen-like [Micropterus dolomieu]|uniref:CD5 antigen-like n=1 Tax=Micropterus dolomieu TaxID=147949 RepID=UPI001E8CB919|nr:CD5 antigen-like [Micropterus dolomieu]
MRTKEFQCGGNESALLDCQIDSSGSARDTCSSGKAVELTCSEPDNVRLVGGSTRCAGELEVKQQGRWEKVDDQTSDWNLKTADVVCEQLDCGSVVSTGKRTISQYRTIWRIGSTCLQSESAVRECLFTKLDTSLSNLEIKCSGPVRLVNRTSPCSGRLESSRGRCMEKQGPQCGQKSSSVEAMSLLSGTVEAQAQLETPAHLAKLLNSPAQSLMTSGWLEEPAAVSVDLR